MEHDGNGSEDIGVDVCLLSSNPSWTPNKKNRKRKKLNLGKAKSAHFLLFEQIVYLSSVTLLFFFFHTMSLNVKKNLILVASKGKYLMFF